MAKQHWLVKSEPAAYAWTEFVRDGTTEWTGVRNFQARNHLRSMRVGDAVLFYASVTTKAVLGVARVSRVAFPDPTATPGAGDWSAVGLTAGKPLRRPVSLAAIKAEPALAQMALLRQSRLSVVPLTPAEFARIVELGR
jgi:predicted RNA-binding protein with PUA-like domain